MNHIEGHMKIGFDYFQTQKGLLLIVRAQKVDEKNRLIFPVSMFPLKV